MNGNKSDGNYLNEKCTDEDPAVENVDCNVLQSDITWKSAIKQSIASCIAHCLVIQAGVNMSYSAILLPQLSLPQSEIPITDTQKTWIASLVTLSLPIGSLATGPLMDRWGRKKICILTAFPLIAAWILQASASEVWHIYAARLLAGFGAGLSTVTTVYVSEITHPNFRPMLLSLNSVFVSFGILVTCVLGLIISWRIMAIIYCCIVGLTLGALFFIPESPHWLVSFRNETNSAAKAMRWLYTDQNVFEQQFQHFLETKSLSRRTDSNCDENSPLLKFKRQLSVYATPEVMKPLSILFVLFIFQQLSGAYVIIFYAVDLFQKLGGHFERGIDDFPALVLLGSIRFVMSFVSAIVAKKVGRRPLMMTSGLGMALTSLLCGLYIYLNVKQDDSISESSDYGYVTLVSVLGYVCFSALGFLIIPWTLIGELLPVKVRGKLGGVLVAVAYLLMFGVVKAFLPILNSVSMHTIFFTICIINLIATSFIYMFLPETFRKSFQEIEKYFLKSSAGTRNNC